MRINSVSVCPLYENKFCLSPLCFCEILFFTDFLFQLCENKLRLSAPRFEVAGAWGAACAATLKHAHGDPLAN